MAPRAMPRYHVSDTCRTDWLSQSACSWVPVPTHTPPPSERWPLHRAPPSPRPRNPAQTWRTPWERRQEGSISSETCAPSSNGANPATSPAARCTTVSRSIGRRPCACWEPSSSRASRTTPHRQRSASSLPTLVSRWAARNALLSVARSLEPGLEERLVCRSQPRLGMKRRVEPGWHLTLGHLLPGFPLQLALLLSI